MPYHCQQKNQMKSKGVFTPEKNKIKWEIARRDNKPVFSATKGHLKYIERKKIQLPIN